MKVCLFRLKKDGILKSYNLPSTLCVIGRRKDCEFCIPLAVVSRRHCEINQDEDILTIRDLNSKNGTYLNGHKITISTIRPGDLLEVGPFKFVFQVDNRPRPEDIITILTQKTPESTSGLTNIDESALKNSSDATQGQ